MANTTNYNWETPDDTDLVKDGALAIRTLGSSVDTTTKALNPSTTLGDIEYRSATANTNTRLAIGTTGQVLTVAGGVPTWASAAGGGGKVLQVVTGTTQTLTTTSSSTYTDTTLTATITPSASTSKVLVLVSQPIQHSLSGTSGAEMFGQVQLQRAGTGITDWRFANRVAAYSNEIIVGTVQSMSYLDSPATTSATIYKTQFKNLGTGSTTVQPGSDRATITLLEIGA